MEQIMHRAAQYLATAAISFLERKEDDSHTNLGWNDSLPGLETRPLSDDGHTLVLNYKTFALAWTKGGNTVRTLSLEGTTHAAIIAWLVETSEQLGVQRAYSYYLHYDLPYPPITDDYTFSLENRGRLEALIENRTLVNGALKQVLMAHDLDSEVRIWPHHFDSGGFVMASETLGVGFGMAVPDTMIPDFYLYVSGYHGHDFVETASFEPLTKGTAYSENWKGIALPVSGLSQADMILFFNEALSRYKS